MGLLEEAPLTLVTSYPEFGTAAAAPHVQFVGPIREPAIAEPWPRRLPERPFVLVSLSTSFQNQFGTLRSIVRPWRRCQSRFSSPPGGDFHPSSWMCRAARGASVRAA